MTRRQRRDAIVELVRQAGFQTLSGKYFLPGPMGARQISLDLGMDSLMARVEVLNGETLIGDQMLYPRELYERPKALILLAE